jgi:hypothetical protein
MIQLVDSFIILLLFVALEIEHRALACAKLSITIAYPCSGRQFKNYPESIIKNYTQLARYGGTWL